MTKKLNAQGIKCSENTVARLMRREGIKAHRAKKFKQVTTDSNHKLPVAKNLLDQCFNCSNVNRAWLTDFTYIPLKEGYTYLCTIQDLYSRRIVGWATSQKLDTKLALAALDQAVVLRSPPKGLILHSDRGSQYASAEFRERLIQCNIVQSMSRKGNCYDNAPQESFFKSFKVEEVYRNQYFTHEQATRAVVDYIERFYNPVRLHSALGYKSPIQFEHTRQLEINCSA